MGKIIPAPFSEQNSYSILCYYKLWFTFEHIFGQELVSISNLKVKSAAGWRSRMIALSVVIVIKS